MSDALEFNTILVDVDQSTGVVTITFNRPDVRNALNREMAQELRAALGILRDIPTCRVLIFTGSGERAFMSGADIAQMKERDRSHAFMRINTRLFHDIEQFPHPTIAAIRGYALGGGCEIALACDLRVAGTSAVLGQPEVGLGILPAAGGCYRLPKLVGLGRAKELIYTGRLVKADEALALGMVESLVPDEEVMDEAHRLANAIAANSQVAVRMAKMMLNNQSEMSTAVAMALESTGQALLYEDPEKHERMGAFLDKRAARRAAREAKDKS
ncbi:MAG: enoyl-CoA hydratase-related protein [Myxococcota bacterium]|nr:enoyl-CoA hydratase-related protein [Myxococcota bacterium]